MVAFIHDSIGPGPQILSQGVVIFKLGRVVAVCRPCQSVAASWRLSVCEVVGKGGGEGGGLRIMNSRTGRIEEM